MVKIFVSCMLFIVQGLLSQQVMANTQITGVQCKAHLQPITMITQRGYYENNGDYFSPYYIINNEITNVLGKPLDEIAKVSSQTPLVKSFVKRVQVTLNLCNQQCGNLIKCSTLKKQNLLYVKNRMNTIKDDEVSEAKVVMDPMPYPSEKETAKQSEPDKSTGLKEDVDDPYYPTRKWCFETKNELTELCRVYDFSDLVKQDQRAEDLQCMFDSNCFMNDNNEVVPIEELSERAFEEAAVF